jgi:hypothetical protein
VTAWIYGHNHFTETVDVGGGLFLRSAQFGYPGEDTGWSGIGSVVV